MSLERVAFAGAGAVGCYFGGMLARAGVPVMLIGRQPHVDRIRRDGLFLERAEFQEYIPVAASTDLAAVREAGIVVVCVKTTDTETAAAALAPLLAPNAIVVSFQNGVDNVERMQRAAGIAAIPAVVYVACSMSGPGRVKHNGRGDIVIGGPSAAAGRISKLFGHAGIPCRVSEHVERELWTKLVMNCAYNAISAVTHARYRFLTGDDRIRGVMKELIREVTAVAAACGVILPAIEQLTEQAFKLGETMATATSSTEQDITRGRATEIDSLNGYVVRRGTELGIPTPVNSTVYALVKFMEPGSAKDQST